MRYSHWLQPKHLVAILLLSLLVLTPGVLSAGDQESPAEEGHDAEAHEERKMGLGSQRSWLFWSMLEGEEDAQTLGLEFESYFHLGSYEVKNISYFEVVDYPRQIPGMPPGNPVEEPDQLAVPDTGINDLLAGFWFSKRGKPHTKHHFAIGFGAQFPTASDDSLGSGKWSLGPSFDYEFDGKHVFAGAIAIQLWSVGGESDRKSVNFLMIKPFVYVHLGEKWDLTYVPYGISIYWDKPSDEGIYLPLGGGFQRVISKHVNLSAQLFKNVLKPTKGPEYDARLMLEIVF